MKIITSLLLCCLLLAGCAGSPQPETVPETTAAPVTETTAAALPTEPEDPIWSLVKDQEFYLSSGAGAWRCILKVDGQGRFSGDYVDTDMGDVGEGYPGGTRYQCQFTGTFTSPIDNGPGNYIFQVTDLQDTWPIHSEIEQEVMVHYVHADQLEGEMFFLFVPGKATMEMPRQAMNWVPFPDRDKPRLTSYVLYNEQAQLAFVSGPAEPWLAGQNLLTMAQDEADFLSAGAYIPDATQEDINSSAQLVYECWDRNLNDLWFMLKDSLPQEEMDTLLQEQRQWIQDKEAAAEASAAEVEGGSLAPLYYYETATQWTRDRVIELVELLPRG